MEEKDVFPDKMKKTKITTYNFTQHCFSSDGSFIAVATDAEKSNRGSVKTGIGISILRVEDQKWVQTIKLKEPVTAMSFSPDSSSLAFADENKTLFVYSFTTGKSQCAELSWWASKIAYSPNGQNLYITRCGNLTVYYLNTGKRDSIELNQFYHSGENLTDLSCKHDGTYIMASNEAGRVVQCSIADNLEYGEVKLSGSVNNIVNSPDDKYLLVSVKNEVIEFDIEIFFLDSSLKVFKGHDEKVVGLAYSPDAKRFASASKDKTICEWSRESEKNLNTYQHDSTFLNVEYSLDGRFMVGVDSHYTVLLWSRGKEPYTLSRKIDLASLWNFSDYDKPKAGIYHFVNGDDECTRVLNWNEKKLESDFLKSSSPLIQDVFKYFLNIKQDEEIVEQVRSDEVQKLFSKRFEAPNLWGRMDLEAFKPVYYKNDDRVFKWELFITFIRLAWFEHYRALSDEALCEVIEPSDASQLSRRDEKCYASLALFFHNRAKNSELGQEYYEKAKLYDADIVSAVDEKVEL